MGGIFVDPIRLVVRRVIRYWPRCAFSASPNNCLISRIDPLVLRQRNLPVECQRQREFDCRNVQLVSEFHRRYNIFANKCKT